MLGFDALSELPISSADTGGFVASGWLAPHFGSPMVLPTAVGFKPIHFGTPSRPFPQTQTASGFMPLQFGLANIEGHFAASGFKVSTFGEPALVPAAVGFRPGRFGMASVALKAVGFAPLHLGTPGFTNDNIASPWLATQFGTPACPVPVTQVASGSMESRFSEPICIPFVAKRAIRAFRAVGLRRTSFGTPSSPSQKTVTASGFLAGGFGLPTNC